MRRLRSLAIMAVTVTIAATSAHAQQFSLGPGPVTIPPLAPYLAGPPCGLAAPFAPAGDLMLLAPPLITIPAGPPGCGLGLPVPANVDAFSSGLGPPAGLPLPAGGVGFLFSVDHFATGDFPGAVCGPPPVAGPFPPDVGSEAGDLTVGGTSDAGADIYGTYAGPLAPLPAGAPLPGTMPHTQLGDGNGLAAPPFFFAPVGAGGLVEPGPGADDIDAADGAPLPAIDFVGPDGVPDVDVYFSVDAATAGGVGVAPGDVLTSIGGAFGIYAPAGALGLLPGDDVDALYVTDFAAPPAAFAPGADTVLFSLAPGSPTILAPTLDCAAGYPIGEGQILTDPAACCALGIVACCAPGAPPCLISDAGAFALWDGAVCGPNAVGAGEDNIDALDLLPGPVPPPATPVATVPPPTPTPTFTPADTPTPTPTLTSDDTPTPSTTATATETVTPAPGATCTPPPPPVGPTPTPIDPTIGTKCQRAIGKEASKFVKAKVKTLQKCEDQKVKGQHTDPCPCPGCAVGSPARKAADKIAKSISKLSAKVAKQCGGADKSCATTGGGQEDPANLGFYATCPDFESSGLTDCTATISTCSEIAKCVECIAEEAIDQGISSVYGNFVGSIVGSTLNKCQRTLGKETTKFLLTKEKEIGKCWDQLRKGKPIGSTVCPDLGGTSGLPAEKAAQKIKKAESKKVVKICKACGGPGKACEGDIDTSLIVPGGVTIAGDAVADDLTPAAIGFLATCPSVTIPGATNCATLDDIDLPTDSINTLRELILCVDCVHEFKVDCIDAAGRPQNQVYPCECR